MRGLLLVVAIAAGGCTTGQARIAKHLGIGLTAEGGAVALVAQVTRDPDDGRFAALVTAAPLLVPGAAMWIIGWLRSR